MNAPTDENSPVQSARRIDRICHEFESQWRAGEPPRIGDYLGRATPADRSALLRELILLDVDYRRSLQQTPKAADYAAQFPEFDPEWLDDLPAVDWLESTVIKPTAQDGSTKRVHCPNCQHSLLADDPSGVVLCPGCGGSFRLHDTRLTKAMEADRQLGKFQLQQRVGVGAFGEVWRAHDTELDRTVAVKIPHASLLSTPEYLDRFHREARAAAQLRHPGIVTVYDVTVLEGTPAIVSQFVEGAPLREVLEARRLAFSEAAELTVHVSEALDYAHSMGLVHRDIKPANIMVETPTSKPLGRPLVVDFGLALKDEAEVAMTLDGQIIGTPAYMSPEQAQGRGHDVDARSDVYSVGVLLYELLCGELPFRGSKVMLLHQVIHEDPMPPRRLNDKIPRDLETICLKCLSKEPESRYDTARELASDLRRHLSGEPIKARPVGPVERVARWTRRHPARAGLIALVFLGTTVGLPAVSWLWQRSEIARKEQEVTLYFQRIALANNEWAANNVGRAEELLDLCPTHLRGWEWHFLKRKRYQPPIVIEPGKKVWWSEFDPSGRIVITMVGDGYAFHDAATSRLLWSASGPAWDFYCSPDGNLIALAFSLRRRDARIEIRELATGDTKSIISSARTMSFGESSTEMTVCSVDGEISVWRVPEGRRLKTLAHPNTSIKSLWHLESDVAVAAADAKGNVSAWRYPDGEFLGTLEACNGAEPTFTWVSWDGTYVAASDKDGAIHVWDVVSQARISTLPTAPAPVQSMGFSRSSHWLAVGYVNGTIDVWDILTASRAFEVDRDHAPILHLEFSPDDRRLVASSGAKSVKMWDTATGQTALTLQGHQDRVNSAIFSADGNRLITSGMDDQTARIWDATPLDVEPVAQGLVIEAHKGPVRSVDFSPDGKRIVSSGEDGTTRVFDSSTGEMIFDLRGHTKYAPTVAYSPNGRYIASAGLDRTVRIWDARSGDLAHQISRPTPVSTVAFASNVELLAVGEEGGPVTVWSTDDWNIVATIRQDAYIFETPLSVDGKWTAVADSTGKVTVCSAQTGDAVMSEQIHDNVVFGLRFSPDGSRLLSGGLDGTVKISDPLSGEPALELAGQNERVFAVAYSPDGRYIASGNYVGTVTIWDAEKGGQPLLTVPGHLGVVWGLQFSPDGAQLAVGSGYRHRGEIHVWDLASLGLTDSAEANVAPK